jgi:hypothetical protein
MNHPKFVVEPVKHP